MYNVIFLTSTLDLIHNALNESMKTTSNTIANAAKMQ